MTLIAALLLSLAGLASDLGYRFRDGICQNSAGQKGLNPNYIGQCGDLRNVTMLGTRFDDLDLRGSDYSSSDLQSSSFTRSNLSYTQFNHSNLSGAVFDYAILESSDFSSAILINAFFPGATFLSSKFSYAEMARIRFNYADLGESNFIGAKLDNSDLAFANLSGCDFTDASIQNASLHWSILDRANFQQTRLRGSFLKNASVMDTNWKGAFVNKKTILPFARDRAAELGIEQIDERVMIIWDNENEDVDSLIQFFDSKGVEAVKSPAPINYLYTIDLHDYTDVVLLAGWYDVYVKYITDEIQQNFREFVVSGGTFIGTQWISYMHDELQHLGYMTDLVLMTYQSSDIKQETFRINSLKANHPVLKNFQSSPTISGGLLYGDVRTFKTHPTDVLMQIRERPAVMVRQFAAGKVVNFAFAASYSTYELSPNTLRQAPVRQLLLNSVKW